MITGHFYLSGPMSGLPQFNFPAFRAAADDLRNRGIKITSPHETDPPAAQEAAMKSPDGAHGPDGKVGGETWGDMLARDVKFIADELSLRGIVFLPGWHNSRGARLEAFVGLLCGREFFTYDQDRKLVPRTELWVQQHLAGTWGCSVWKHE